ncbi:hypothetical protein BJF83_20565 [Nocardiopsis sp. CNR-923]|uniref:hypothetical protein n=1 Tax=Nocardiopsis sp. CNR-923 TaxID=1904965 RepID=UPI000962897B|nr:hypothetical protein [Nocardiopsis sp. CNR-923]OLT26622.1 hypothetical protein BJF83_20565 [Nocardiopsis sp. CNR-923]
MKGVGRHLAQGRARFDEERAVKGAKSGRGPEQAAVGRPDLGRGDSRWSEDVVGADVVAEDAAQEDPVSAPDQPTGEGPARPDSEVPGSFGYWMKVIVMLSALVACAVALFVNLA